MKFLNTFALLMILGAACAAKDAVQVSVTPASGPSAIVVVNGNPYSPGTFAVGTIQIFYTVNAYQFPAVSSFATFRVGLNDVAYGGNPATTYSGLTLNLQQNGSGAVLVPAPATFQPTGPGWAGESIVTVSIPASIAADPALNGDGDEIVGNLKLAASPAGAHLDTPTSVQVHIKLVHPTNCLRVFDFITDEAFTTAVTSTQVNVNKTKGTVNATNPYGQFSQNILVVNSCGVSQTFSLGTALDAAFETTPHGNPGNAVFTYTKSGYADPASFNISAFGSGTGQGQKLCLTGITVPSGESFLQTVHMGVTKGMAASALPAGNVFNFSATLYSGSACSGTPFSLATPNPATATLSFTTY